ncbi:MAG: bifunctional diaminohydroxyphosphoribosylaminopyrimidine deaminase/5-amino-6-(5-phosphoribosylamino)uracil reductase RibD [Deltaproteobacteria bacterium]|nr:bifunctional diaminohydroxyphosphoribosylaminopyrimidine deaminase/5-amino-6-(5-phosphoribosylamino)uracil reductase RibD [Deltaproteobacteria bacterium]
MRRCLELARKGARKTSPNPMVGAVIVKNDRILAEGYHRRVGGPHAEIEALKKIGYRAHGASPLGATLYCNLEPCFHHGRTPPCVSPIIKSRIKRVVIAHRDPNPLVAGKSVRLLKKSGIRVTEGVLEKEARELNRFFLTWVVKKRPYVILKAGVSLDGKIAAGIHPPPGPLPSREGGSRKSPLPWGERVRERGTHWITSPISRRRVHQLRAQVDAVLVGKNTVISDNPRLNVRGIPGAKQPLRIILDSKSEVTVKSKIFISDGGSVLVATVVRHPLPGPLPSRERGKVKSPLPGGEGERGRVEMIQTKSKRGQVSLANLMKELAHRNITSVLVEGGAKVFASFLKSGLCDELILFVAPKILGPAGLDLFPTSTLKKFPFKISSVTPSGPDIEVHFILQ